tara:strand:+ start:3174 stop:3398 length:225 start_codon:yes stop_codon:yes gene_type:complete
MKSQVLYKKKARELLNINGITSTDVCEYVYGSKTRKSRLNQKKTGKTQLMFQESSRIIEYYSNLAQTIDDIIAK